MLSGTFLAVISPEGWLDPEAHESDLRGSRGVAVAGGLLIFMGVANFRNTVRPLKPIIVSLPVTEASAPLISNLWWRAASCSCHVNNTCPCGLPTDTARQ